MNLEDLIYQQNPQWLTNNYSKPELGWYYRSGFKQSLSWLEKRLIIALSGLRRTGKSTILNQLKYKLEDTTESKNILFFSFEKSQIKLQPDTLRTILTWYFETFLKIIPRELTNKTYIFLDEIQYIPYWQDIVKTYYDQNPLIKFLISGSSSLFIEKKSSESLAGRIVKIKISPLDFCEYLTMKKISPREQNINQLFKMRPRVVNSYFQEYLNFGQFPELIQENYTAEQAKIYIVSIEEKIIQQDLPKLFPIKRPDVLSLIFDFLKANHGSITEYKNLSNDLGVNLKTVINYINYLKKAYLINICLNKTKKPVKAARTAKKLYLGSTNFSTADISIKVENYIYNLLNKKYKTLFYRQKQFEVDFVIQQNSKLIPLEVKYKESLKKQDFTNIVKLAIRYKSAKAFLISKNLLELDKQIDNKKIQIIPAALFEQQFTPGFKSLGH